MNVTDVIGSMFGFQNPSQLELDHLGASAKSSVLGHLFDGVMKLLGLLNLCIFLRHLWHRVALEPNKAERMHSANTSQHCFGGCR